MQNEFIHQIKLPLKNKELQLKLSKNARLKAEQFSWKSIELQWQKILQA